MINELCLFFSAKKRRIDELPPLSFIESDALPDLPSPASLSCIKSNVSKTTYYKDSDDLASLSLIESDDPPSLSLMESDDSDLHSPSNMESDMSALEQSGGEVLA